MNKSKIGSYGKILTFTVVATALICIFGFSADGWQSINNKEPDSGNTEDEIGKADENTDGDNEEGEAPSEPEVYIPEYVNALTGLESSGELARMRPTAFVMSSTSPTYGIHGADIIAEFPTESGETRFLVFQSEVYSLGKIGSITPTRRYISNIAKYFGAILVSSGSDDEIEYSGCDMTSSSFDLSLHSGYHYTEFTHFNYSNGALITAGVANANIGTAINSRLPLPYSFTEFGAEPLVGTESAKSVSIPYSQASETEMYYSEKDGKYTFSKGGVTKNDMLNDKPVQFTNVFILFADTVTYESAEATELVMNTDGKGVGYYLTQGTVINIRWEATDDGTLNFYTDSGERLTVNRGSSYIGFIKSSLHESVKFN